MLGDRVRQVRKNNRITQQEFCDLICISQPHLSKVENGIEKLSKAAIRLISKTFNVNEDWLING